MFKLLYDPFKIRIAYLLLEPFIFTYGAGKGVGCHAHGNGSFEVFFFFVPSLFLSIIGVELQVQEAKDIKINGVSVR